LRYFIKFGSFWGALRKSSRSLSREQLFTGQLFARQLIATTLLFARTIICPTVKIMRQTTSIIHNVNLSVAFHDMRNAFNAHYCPPEQ